ncbi:hypothetical protein [Pseudonocardia kunmingensis]|uniref:Uncharacterized protein n=1 Tax=Pseudonocardia kunmingensis TaxID=630975 RepID=A0A543CX18_9PSEU|nr:hypothetical protein [Pseudonocardia kunmingensis]TQM01654.1 hypothetical protein FB558_8555 [Pseudonocardia kunmingensis]
MVVGCLVFARRFAAARQPAMAAGGVGAGIAVVAVIAWPDLDSTAVRLVLGSAIEFAFVAFVAARLIRESRGAR